MTDDDAADEEDAAEDADELAYAELADDDASGKTVEMPLKDARAPTGRPHPPLSGLPLGKIEGAKGVLESALLDEQMYWTGGELDESMWTWASHLLESVFA